MVLYAVPAFGERITPKARNADRTGKIVQRADSAIPIAEAPEGRTAVVGTVFSNFDYPNGYIAPAPCTGCVMVDDYDSINDAPFIQGQFRFLGGAVGDPNGDGGVVWFTFLDSLGSFVSSSGWLLSSGLFIYSFDHTGLAATDAGFVQFYPSSGYWNPGLDTYGTWLANATGPQVGTEDPTVGGPDPENSFLFELNAVDLGRCCILLTGACSYGAESACAGEFTINPDPDACINDPCDEGTCGNGVIDPPDEECDDGNTDSGDGCDSLCREETVYIPAVSEWGLLVMALIGLTVGTVLFGRRRAMA